ncbi:MAG: hypothetical protein KKD69_06580 [Euryarchaeota archaeon]|nr:hypothetical protein [Euryarchaeota archaeon]
MNTAVRLLIAALALAVVTSCTHSIAVPLRPNYQEALRKDSAFAKLQPPLRFSKGTFADKRPDTTMLSSFKQQAHTFNLHAERPIDEAIFDGIKTMLTNSGHTWSESAPQDVRIDMQLVNVQASRNAGFFEVTASSSVQVKLDFIDASSGKSIYSDIYTGKDDRGRAMIGLMSMVIESIDASVIDLVNKVGNDERLAAALKAVAK